MINNYRHYMGLIMFCAIFGLAGCSEDGRTAAEYIDSAKQYQSQGRLQAGVIELKNALKKAPENARARALLGRLYIELGDGASAEKELRRALEYGDAWAATRMDMARAQLMQGEAEAAMETLNKLSPKAGSGQMAEQQALIAKAYLHQDEIDPASRHIRKALEVAPSHAEYLLTQSQILVASEEIEAGRKILEKALAARPSFSEALLFKARLAQLQNDTETAKAAYKKVIEQAPSSRLTPRLVTAHTGLALLLISEGELEAARASADVLYKANNKHPMSNYIQGLIAYRTKNYEKAVEYLRITHNEMSDHPPTLLILGGANYALGHYNQAVSYLNNYLTRVPGDLRANKLLAGAYIRLDEPGEAMRILETSLEQMPDDTQLLSMAGEAAVRAGKLELGKGYLKQAASSDGTGTTRRRLASIYMAEGDNQQAIEELEAAVLESDEDTASVVLLIKAYLRNGQTERALDRAKQYLDTHPADAYGYNLLGAVHVAAGNRGEAQAQFAAALEQAPDNIPARINLARLAMLDSDWAEARSYLEGVLEDQADHSLSMMLLAQIARETGDQAKAVEWLTKAAKSNAQVTTPRLLLANYYAKRNDSEQALRYVDEILAVEPDNASALGLKVELLTRSGELEQALTAAEAMVNAHPDQPVAHAKLGQVQLARQNQARAREALEKALQLRPDFFPAAAALARLELQLGAVDKALTLARQVQQTQPKAPAGYALQADIHLADKQYAKAAQSYAEAMARGATAEFAVQRAKALRLAGEPWSVVRAPLEDWLQAHPEDVAVWARLAMEANAAGQREAAIEAYRQALKYQPDNAVLLNDLAWLLYEQTPDAEAVELARKAHQLNPDAGAIQDTYGWMLVQEGEVTEGLKLLGKAHQSIPQHPEIAFHYAFALKQAGKTGKAREVLEQLLGQHERFPSRPQAEKLLEAL